MKLLCGDSEELIPLCDLPKRYVVVTDPPYGLPGEDVEKALRILALLDPVSAIVFSDWRNSHRYAHTWGHRVGELIWEYGWVSGGRTRAKSGFFPTHNTLHLFGDVRFVTGSIIKRGPGLSSPRQCSFAHKTGHPYEKPVKLLELILEGLPNLPVIDPFAGSGTTLVAAQKVGRDWVGIEENLEYFKMAHQRLRQ